MGVKVTDLQADRRELTFGARVGADENGAEILEDVKLTYRPSAYTGKQEKELNELAKGEWKSAMGIRFVQDLVAEWDVLDIDDTPFPITEEKLAELPSSFIGEVISAIGDDMGKARRSSNAG